MSLTAAGVLVSEVSFDVVKAECGALKKVMLSFALSSERSVRLAPLSGFWCEGVVSVRETVESRRCSVIIEANLAG